MIFWLQVLMNRIWACLEHNIGQVLEQLEVAGLSLKKSKCVFMTKSMEYLSHVIDASGLAHQAVW